MSKQKNILDRATKALMKEPILAGPPQNVVSATLGRLASEATEAEAQKTAKAVRIAERIEALRHFGRIAAAVLIVIGVCVGIRALYRPGVKPIITVRQERLKAERDQIDQMFAANDVGGLIAMLSTGLSESKVAAANYLGTIGDLRAIEPLEKLSAQWDPAKGENPFEKAINQIKTRIEKEQEKQPESKGEKDLQEQSQKERPAAATIQAGFSPRGVLSGLATDIVTGEPINSVKVQITKERIYWAVTDANGFYSFDAIDSDGRYRVKILSADYVVAKAGPQEITVQLSRGTQRVRHFGLQFGCSIDFRVVDEDGQPVEAVTLRASRPGDMTGYNICQAQKTNKVGETRMGAFVPSQAPILIILTHNHYAPAKYIGSFTEPNTVEYAEIVMKKGTAVTGYAEYADGLPAAKVRVIASPDWWYSDRWPAIFTADSEGSFTLEHIVPGNYRVQVITQDGSVPTVDQMQLPPIDGELVITVPGRAPASLASISGVISYTGKKRIGIPDVEAISASGQRHRGTFESKDNSFKVSSLEPGFYTLVFSGPHVQSKTVENIEAPSSDLEIELDYPVLPRLRGFVVRKDTGEPIQTFQIRLRQLKRFAGPRTVQKGTWHEFRNEQGRFEVGAVADGIYQFQVLAEGLAGVWSEPVSSDSNEPVLIQVPIGGTIKGRVVNEAGEGISAAKVVPLSRTGGTMPNTKDLFVSEDGAVETIAGEFELQNVPPGFETIKVTHPDYCSSILGGIEVKDGLVAEDIEVVLQTGGSVQGYVYDAQGRVRPNVTLIFQDHSGYPSLDSERAGRVGIAVTDSNGLYRVGSLPQKLIYVRRGDYTQNLGVVRRAFVPEKGKTKELNFGGEPIISGQAVLGAQPLARAKLLLAEPRNAALGKFKCYAVTDFEGRFYFGGAPPGQYGVYYDPPGERYPLKLAVIDIGREDEDVGIIGQQMVAVTLSVTAAAAEGPVSDWYIYLQEGTHYWGQRVGPLRKVPEQQGRYVVPNLLAGEYTFTAWRRDYPQIQQTFTVAAGEKELAVPLKIPACTSTIHGSFFNKLNRSVILQKSDMTVTAPITSGEAGQYELTYLPAGQYTIGFYSPKEIVPMMTFSLSEDQTKVVDIDTSNWLPP